MMEKAITLSYKTTKTVSRSVTRQFQEIFQDFDTIPYQTIPHYDSLVLEIEYDEFNDENSQTLVWNNNLEIQKPIYITISEAIYKLRNYTSEIRKKELEFEKKELEDLTNFLQRNNEE